MNSKSINIIFRLSTAGILMCITLLAQSQAFDEKMKSLYKNTVPLIDTESLLSLSSDSVIILDCRSMREFEISHIAKAQFVDYDNYSRKTFKTIPHDSKVVVYCSVGYRSERVGEFLKGLGYTDVHNLYGGIFDWKNKGQQVINAQGVTTDSVHTYNEDWSQWLENGIKVYD